MCTSLFISPTVTTRSPTLITTALFDSAVGEQADKVKRRKRQKNREIKYLIILILIIDKLYLLNNLRKGMGVFFCLCPYNKAPCYAVSKLGNSKLTLELYAPSISPNFETATKLKLYLRA